MELHNPVRIATRRSKLALAQSHWVKAQLEAFHPGLRVELREYVTRGDQIQNVPLSQVGGKGLFTKEIEDALLSDAADLAVHSLKDLPSELPPGLALAAVPPREDPRDALVLPAGVAGDAGSDALAAVSPGARVGSSSLRRAAQLRQARPDLVLESVRGNVDTRLRKLDEGQYGALILACAGLRRLGLADRISTAIPEGISTPAPGQGALGLETREDDARVRGLLAPLDDLDTRCCVTAERALMDALGAGCSTPLGALGRVEGNNLHLIAVVALPDGSHAVRQEARGPSADPAALGRALAETLLAAGGAEILAALRTA